MLSLLLRGRHNGRLSAPPPCWHCIRFEMLLLKLLLASRKSL